MIMKTKTILLLAFLLVTVTGKAVPKFVHFYKNDASVAIVDNGLPIDVAVDTADYEGIHIAIKSFVQDMKNVCGKSPTLINMMSDKAIIVGSIQKSNLLKQLKIDTRQLKGKREKYLIQTIDNKVVIAGSDMRGTIYGIYELSKQIGVSPWYWWADAPIIHHDEVYVKNGTYTDGEPAVRYRGIFINDEAPCFTGWVKNMYGTNYGDHRMYARMFELLLRLKANFLWPAMWGWAFYADDPLNTVTARKMGIVMGTSHHEPMARNHQEWARNRRRNGAWNYQTNKEVLDKFFKEGIERAQGSEDLITIGMRGDGDEPMSAAANTQLLENIINNQRNIIEQVTGKPAKETPQVWALYKEVLEYYDKGMRIPDDVTILLCDDNWGNVNRLPNKKERVRKGGWGMYYHVDYVGAPRNSKWLNCTPIHNMWEQMQLTYDYGVDRLWVLNVGDLKPMEYPITLFLDMAWNPHRYEASNILDHTRSFCAELLGDSEADEAARILNLYTKYNGRCTPEMLDAKTYNLETGEWKQVVDEYSLLERDALRQYAHLSPQYRDTYKQIILYPVQAMANLYDMYYSQAMNHQLYHNKKSEANYWADRVEKDFAQDKALAYDYNNVMSQGKWKGMMTQKHIGYRSWSDDFREDILPQVFRIADDIKGKNIFKSNKGYISIEAEHYYDLQNTDKCEWTIMPYMGRTLSGIALRPYTESTDGAWISYKMYLPDTVKQVRIHVITKSTLAFSRIEGHRYEVSMDDGKAQVINFNGDMKDDKEHQYTTYYPVVARRVVEKIIPIDVKNTTDGMHLLRIAPLDPGIVFEKIVVDYGGYQKQYLFGTESERFNNL